MPGLNQFPVDVIRNVLVGYCAVTIQDTLYAPHWNGNHMLEVHIPQSMPEGFSETENWSYTRITTRAFHATVNSELPLKPVVQVSTTESDSHACLNSYFLQRIDAQTFRTRLLRILHELLNDSNTTHYDNFYRTINYRTKTVLPSPTANSHATRYTDSILRLLDIEPAHIHSDEEFRVFRKSSHREIHFWIVGCESPSRAALHLAFLEDRIDRNDRNEKTSFCE
jgi:hypothetical protein